MVKQICCCDVCGKNLDVLKFKLGEQQQVEIVKRFPISINGHEDYPFDLCESCAHELNQSIAKTTVDNE